MPQSHQEPVREYQTYRREPVRDYQSLRGQPQSLREPERAVQRDLQGRVRVDQRFPPEQVLVVSQRGSELEQLFQRERAPHQMWVPRVHQSHPERVPVGQKYYRVPGRAVRKGWEQEPAVRKHQQSEPQRQVPVLVDQT